jgi:hypothetical protein
MSQAEENRAKEDIEKYIEFLNTSFFTKREFDEEDFCRGCEKSSCCECGNEIDCEENPETCCKVLNAREEFEPIQKESFEYDKTLFNHGAYINGSRSMAVMKEKTDLGIFNEFYKAGYKEIEQLKKINWERFKKINWTMFDFLFMNTNEEINIAKNTFHKESFLSALKLVSNPKLYLAEKDSPLIIQDKNITILLAARAEED